MPHGYHSTRNRSLDDPQWTTRRWNGIQAYSDSKLFDTILAFGVARRWPHVLSNSVEPGWVPTTMGGADAPDDLAQGPVTQAWLAVSDEPAATVTGKHFYHRRERTVPAEAHDPAVQDTFLAYCAELTAVSIPEKH